MEVTFDVLANITIRVLMIVVAAFVIAPKARELISDKKYFKGILLLVLAFLLIVVKVTVDMS